MVCRVWRGGCGFPSQLSSLSSGALAIRTAAIPLRESSWANIAGKGAGAPVAESRVKDSAKDRIAACLLQTAIHSASQTLGLSECTLAVKTPEQRRRAKQRMTADVRRDLDRDP